MKNNQQKGKQGGGNGNSNSNNSGKSGNGTNGSGNSNVTSKAKKNDLPSPSPAGNEREDSKDQVSGSAGAAGSNKGSILGVAGTQKQAQEIANYLRSVIEVKSANMSGVRKVEYFRGKALIEALLTEASTPEEIEQAKKKLPKGKPLITNREEVMKVGSDLLRHHMIISAEVIDAKKRMLREKKSTQFAEDGYYVWKYEGSPFMRNLMLALVAGSVIGIAMFPVWPMQMKVGVWYISVTILILLFSLFTIRGAVALLFWIFGFDFWIFPNLQNETLGFFDSFKPLYSFERSEDISSTWHYRAGVVAVIVAFGVWVYNQPTEFDDFLDLQRQFVNDLYEGNLLSDKSETEKKDIDKIIPDLSDLENMKIDDEFDVNQFVDKADGEEETIPVNEKGE